VTIRLRTIPRGVRCGSVALSAVAISVAVPVFEVYLARRGAPRVPGPHALDGLLSSGPGPKTVLRCVWLGDSLSAGVGAEDADHAFPRQAAALLASQFGCDVDLVCLAAPGAASADVLADQVPAAVAILRPGMTAVVAVGCNDVAQMVRPRAFRANYVATLDALTSTGAMVVAVGLPDMGSATVLAQPLRAIVGWAGRHISTIVREVTADAGAQFVAIGCGPPGEGRRCHRARALLSADRWHPNGDGYRIWAALVAAHLFGIGTTPT
jgi:lysophospholipase L1-like esterase